MTISRAGSARVDITPPPGYQTGGHGPSGTTARGYWGRLTATAFYLEDSSGRGAALVSVDSFGIPNQLHQDVATHFAAGASALPLERIVLAATHTHHGPGNFLSVEAHNKHGSESAGYDPRLRTFLRERLIAVIEASIADAVAHPGFELDITTGTLPETLFRNRSPRVFRRNDNRGEMLAAFGSGIRDGGPECGAAREYGEPADAWAVSGCPRLRAVDRGASLLRIRRNGRTAAMAVFAAAHPTVLPASTPLFSPDVFGIAQAVLEQSAVEPIPRVAFFNGAEGDITMRRTTRNAVDLLRLGRLLAASLKGIHDTGAARPLDVGTGIQGRLHFASPGEVLSDGSGQRIAGLAGTALGGVAGVGGAEDDRLFLYKWGFREGHTRRPRGEHGVKKPVFGMFTGWVFPQHVFARRLPLSIVRIGDLTIAATPFEMSTAVGFAIRKALRLERGRLEIVGVANEYGSYTATADEYQAQDYMGASTLWGPEQAAFIVELLRRLSAEAPGASGTAPADDPGKEEQFGPHRIRSGRKQVFKGLEDLVSFIRPAGLPSFFCWCEDAPPPLPAQTGRTVEVLHQDGTVADRLGVVVVLDGRPRGGRARWAAIWVSPLVAPHPGQYRFRVVPDGTPPIHSELFEFGRTQPAPVCAPLQ